jgi:hypothetical protein
VARERAIRLFLGRGSLVFGFDDGFLMFVVGQEEWGGVVDGCKM